VTGTIAIVGMLPDPAAAQTIPFQQVKDKNCTASECSLTFQVPARERREVISVSCSAEVQPNNVPLRTAQLLAFNQAGADKCTNSRSNRNRDPMLASATTG